MGVCNGFIIITGHSYIMDIWQVQCVYSACLYSAVKLIFTEGGVSEELSRDPCGIPGACVVCVCVCPRLRPLPPLVWSWEREKKINPPPLLLLSRLVMEPNPGN